uniref:DNA-directed RNA polymerase n=1 Tax=Steinernema glaseri TaxID=37863 RepID=A0A1I8AV68_9BILA
MVLEGLDKRGHHMTDITSGRLTRDLAPLHSRRYTCYPLRIGSYKWTDCSQIGDGIIRGYPDFTKDFDL